MLLSKKKLFTAIHNSIPHSTYNGQILENSKRPSRFPFHACCDHWVWHAHIVRPCGVSMRRAKAPRVRLAAWTIVPIFRVWPLLDCVELSIRLAISLVLTAAVWFLVQRYLISVLPAVRDLRAEWGTVLHPPQLLQGKCRLQVTSDSNPLIVQVTNYALDAAQSIESISHLIFTSGAAHRHHQVDSDTFPSSTMGQLGHIHWSAHVYNPRRVEADNHPRWTMYTGMISL